MKSTMKQGINGYLQMIESTKLGMEKGEDITVTRNKSVLCNDKYWVCWTSVDDVIDIIGLFWMSCQEEFGECTNNDCGAMILYHEGSSHT